MRMPRLAAASDRIMPCRPGGCIQSLQRCHRALNPAEDDERLRLHSYCLLTTLWGPGPRAAQAAASLTSQAPAAAFILVLSSPSIRHTGTVQALQPPELLQTGYQIIN
jgi:hypothetical protein